MFKKNQPYVLISTPIYIPLTGGASTYFSSLVHGLTDEVNFVVLTTYVKKEPIIEADDNSIIYRSIPNILSCPLFFRYFIIPIIIFNIFILFILYKPKIIHCHSSASFGFGTSLISKMLNVKIIKEVQDMGLIGFNLKLGNVVKYISTGNTIKNKLLSLGIPDSKIITFPALNPPECKNIYYQLKTEGNIQSQNKFILLFVGTLSRSIKGIDTLILGFEQVHKIQNDAILIIVGDGPDRDWCKNQIKKMNLEQSILMKGSLNYQETLYHIYMCDVLLLPSRTEANPRVILEAFQFAKPVIATSVGGVSDIVQNEYNGLLIKENSPDELAKAVLKLAQNKSIREKLGTNGQQFVESLPQCQELHMKILDLYKQII